MTAAPALAAGIDDLRPHRAVYDLSLVDTSDRSGITDISGRIVYEMKGSVCEGFAVRFRFLTNVQAGRREFTNDQRATTFEAGDSSSFNFVTQSYLNGQLEDDVRGQAERGGAGLEIELSQPDEVTLELDDAMFQSEHVAMLIDAARNGETVATAKVYDGSDQGDQLMDTTAIIGKMRTLGPKLDGESDEVVDALRGEQAWPVSVSYFTTDDMAGSGEKLPVYQVSFLMLADGVSRDLTMRYEDYSLKGALTDVEYLDAEPCEPLN